MAKNDNEENSSVALYWDFENLHAGLFEAVHGEGTYGKSDGRFKAQEPFIDVQALVELASSFGSITRNRASGNWRRFGRNCGALHPGKVDLIRPFAPRSNAKNRADFKVLPASIEDTNKIKVASLDAHVR